MQGRLIFLCNELCVARVYFETLQNKYLIIYRIIQRRTFILFLSYFPLQFPFSFFSHSCTEFRRLSVISHEPKHMHNIIYN